MADLECALCGFLVGTGLPGQRRYCARCEEYVVTEARSGNAAAVGGAIAAVAIGLIGAYLIKKAIEG